MVEFRALFSAEKIKHNLLIHLQIWNKCDDAEDGPQTPDPGAMSSWQDIKQALAGNWYDIGDGEAEEDD